MDILISAPRGKGKSTMAILIANAWLAAQGAPVDSITHYTGERWPREALERNSNFGRLREPSAIIFDEIPDVIALDECIRAAEHWRKSGRIALFIYVRQDAITQSVPSVQGRIARLYAGDHAIICEVNELQNKLDECVRAAEHLKRLTNGR